MLLSQAFHEAALKKLSTPAVLDLGVSTSYGDLKKRIGQLSYLYQSELPANEPVAMLASNGLAVVQTFFSLSNIGNPVLFLNPKDSDESIVQDLKTLGILTILITSDQSSRLENIRRMSGLALNPVEIEKKKGGEYDPSFMPPPDRPLKDTDSVLILRQEEYGEERKYVFFPHKKLVAATVSVKRFYRLTANDRLMTTMNWSHPFALTHGMLLPLFTGATCAVDPQSPTIEEFIEYLAKERITRFVGPPKFYLDLLSRCAAAKYKLPGIKSITVGLGSLSLALRKTFKLLNIPILRCYGRTEAIWSLAMDNIEAGLEIESAKSRPGPGMKFKVLNAEGDEAPGPGPRVGPLAVMGESLFTAYFHPDKDVAAKATRNKMRGTWFYTGEIARLEGEGDELTVAVLGKASDMVNSSGEYLSPRPIDEAGKNLPGIVDAAGFVHIGKEGERSLACAVVIEQKAISEPELLTILKERLPEKNHPSAVFVVEKIPRDEFESVNRLSLQRQLS